MKTGKKKCGLVLVAAFAVLAGSASGQEITRLGQEGQALYGATHRVRFTYRDFTTSTTNTAQTFNVPVSARSFVSVPFMRLLETFDTADTNHTSAVVLRVGDAGTTDRFLSDTELADDGTTIWLKTGRIVYNTGQATNTVLADGVAAYATATNVTFRFTPDANQALNASVQGAVEVYLRVLDR